MGSSPGADSELRTRVQQQEVVAEFGQQALETDDIDQLLHDASVAVADTLDTEYCKVLELLPGGDEVLLRQGVGWQDGLVGTATAPTDLDSQAGYTLRSEEPVVVDDLRTEDRFSGPDLLVNHDVVSGVSVIIGSLEDPWGVLGTHTTERRAFTEYDVNFVQSIANVLASAIETRRAKRSLEAQKEVKERIVETSPVGIVVFGANGDLQFVNEYAESILGRDRENLESVAYDDPRWRLTDADGNPLSGEETPFMRVIETGKPAFDMEVGLRRPDGERIWVTVNGAPLDVDGKGAGAVLALTDVTDQKRLESEFEEMLGRVTDAFYAVDDEFRFMHVNERAAELLQRPRAELLGEKLWELYPEAAEVDEVWDAFHTALNDQVSTSYDLYFDPLDFWVEANLYPSETGVSVYFRDITESKQHELELERYRALTEAANDVIVTIDAESTIRSVNPAVEDVFGYEPNELIGESLTKLMRDDLAVRHQAGLQRYLETNERTLDWDYVELKGQCADGSAVSLSITFSEIVYENDRYFTGVIRNISDRKKREWQLERANERLTRSNRRLEQFAYAASHDLQEPLRMVSSYLQLIEQRYGDDLDADGTDYLEFAIDGANRMRAMIEGLLEYSRIETGGKPLEPTDLDAVFEDVLDDLAGQIERSNATITSDSLPRVQGDRTQLRQLFQNLLDNAMTYSGDEPPQIHVSAEQDETEWVVSVCDEGIGLDPARADRVFEVFQRLHSREEYSGSGIGLALCKRIIERHGGDIWVDAELGEGATFSVTLPAPET
ncbi:PAS domain S-box protein [Natronosalvus rutilus]|uniref:histidine kinase n=1 Tax=Natronosalvus rutilus TaxID=2953753 RepID=A0A9E7N976_9EURY|nr:PAS domain S-box protein [Natronosalvus rutilus]UTF52683.1 PAS domain S-box protein [Natronosalvus rutilus]